jgi:hypothetical protein
MKHQTEQANKILTEQLATNIHQKDFGVTVDNMLLLSDDWLMVLDLPPPQLDGQVLSKSYVLRSMLDISPYVQFDWYNYVW